MQSGEAANVGCIGTVVAVQANYYQVRLDTAAAENRPTSRLDNSLERNTQTRSTSYLLCTRRTRLKKIGQQVMVGDRVNVENPDWQGERGAIAAILPRTSELDRPPVANATQILLVFALAEPDLDPHQLSRFLVKAESTGLRVCLALSKSDLVEPSLQDQWRDRLQTWGYQPHLISVKMVSGLDELLKQLVNQTTIISGPSGVGKSSLINTLIPQAQLRVAQVSGKLGRGRHTTRHVELFDLPTGGLLADSPGFNQPQLDYPPLQLAQLFPEARQRLAGGSCQFNDCLHLEEPNCVVRGDWERYLNYCDLLAELQVLHTTKAESAAPEAVLKQKVGQAGHVDLEPKLAQKKYRRQSRRSGRQALQSLTGAVTDLQPQDEE